MLLYISTERRRRPRARRSHRDSFRAEYEPGFTGWAPVQMQGFSNLPPLTRRSRRGERRRSSYPPIASMDLKRASSASFARERQLPGLSFLKTVPLRSKITFSTPRRMRRRSDQPDFEKSAGMRLAYLLRGKRPLVETSGAAFSTTPP